MTVSGEGPVALLGQEGEVKARATVHIDDAINPVPSLSAAAAGPGVQGRHHPASRTDRSSSSSRIAMLTRRFREAMSHLHSRFAKGERAEPGLL